VKSEIEQEMNLGNDSLGFGEMEPSEMKEYG
jgi:hypothetical protein